tara:strand:- start:271 stop:789 length:519 start_codon:yes stop_codon:yes gene_type:complete
LIKKEHALFLFDYFDDAMKSEHILSKNNFDISIGAPPPNVRTGCDLAIGISTKDFGKTQKILEENNIDIFDVVFVPKTELMPLQLSKLIKIVDFGIYLMVRCGNMKITVEKETELIVNISGGGCPDIPLLSMKIVGTKLNSGPRPRELGTTLCAYTLDKAYENAVNILNGVK